jgi:uncharacterized protein YaiI (UPF0178 family)
MHIWVDADACPVGVKEILYRAAERSQIAMTLVANKPLAAPRSPFIRSLQVARGFHALNPRGELYTRDTIEERLSTRDFLAKLRETGVQTGGPAALDQTDRKRFADQLDRFLARLPKR